MTQLWRAFGSVVPIFLVIVFVITITSYIIYRYRGINIKIVISDRLLVLSIIAILLVTLGTGTYDVGAQRIYNLVPLVGTYEMIVNDAHPWILIRNIFLNILLFMPFGFFMRMCMFMQNRITRKITLIGLLLSVCIEVTQFILPTGRWADVDDVILNTMGTFLGCVLWSVLNKGFPSLFSLPEDETNRYTEIS